MPLLGSYLQALHPCKFLAKLHVPPQPLALPPLPPAQATSNNHRRLTVPTARPTAQHFSWSAEDLSLAQPVRHSNCLLSAHPLCPRLNQPPSASAKPPLRGSQPPSAQPCRKQPPFLRHPPSPLLPHPLSPSCPNRADSLDTSRSWCNLSHRLCTVTTSTPTLDASTHKAPTLAAPTLECRRQRDVRQACLPRFN